MPKALIRIFILLIIVRVTFSIGFTGLAQPSIPHSIVMNSQDLESKINQIANDYVSKREHVALTIGAIQQDRPYIKGFGEFSNTQPSAPSVHTVYEIGCITKVFTGTVLAALVNDGTVSLTVFTLKPVSWGI